MDAFVHPVTNRMSLGQMAGEEISACLSLKLPDEFDLRFLHESAHHWCFHTPIGAAARADVQDADVIDLITSFNGDYLNHAEMVRVSFDFLQDLAARSYDEEAYAALIKRVTECKSRLYVEGRAQRERFPEFWCWPKMLQRIGFLGVLDSDETLVTTSMRSNC